jgi:hypothetical protein
MAKLLLGQITFFDPQIDGEHKAIIHRIDEVIEYPNEDIAMENGEELLDFYESYLVLGTYTGELEYDKKYSKIIEE